MRRVRAFAPGRTELAGNHTDHQGGRVIAAAVDCGVEILAQATGDGRAQVESDGFDPVAFDVADDAPRESERFTTAALVRGVIAGLRRAGLDVGGFDARVSSTVPPGSGLSSSAAFELALSRALQALFACEDAPGTRELSALEHARIAQSAERDHFGKMCGLMDQLSVALGGVALIDFSNGDDPSAQRLQFDFEEHGYALCLVDTHCDHSAYTREYSQVALDMFDVARFLGAEGLSHVPEQEFFGRFEDVRAALGDAPALRGLHYYHEMRLVDARARALEAGDMQAFLQATRRSGASSAQYLQNVSTADRQRQPAMVALALADCLLQGDGACRIHGGGFGGTVQAFVPLESYEMFAQAMDAHLGPGSCMRLRMSEKGAHATCLES